MKQKNKKPDNISLKMLIELISRHGRSVILGIIVGLLSINVSAGRWKQHTGFDANPRKIIDTGTATYFHVLQAYYNKNQAYHNVPLGGILVYDKKNPWKGIVPLATSVPLSEVNVRLAEYSPEGKFLAIIYDDGLLDIVDESGNVRKIDALNRAPLPGSNVVNSMTICGKEIWIGTQSGFMAVDGKEARIISKVDFAKNVGWIGRTGDRITAYINNVLYDSDGAHFTGKLSGFVRVTLTGSQASPFGMMPIKNGFVYLANKKSAGTCSLNVAWRENGRWNCRFLKDLSMEVYPGGNVAYQVAHRMEKNCTRNKEGWIITTNSSLIQVYADKDPAAESVFDEKPVSMALIPGGSWDFNECWGYSDRGAFVKGRLTDGKFVMDDRSEAIRPNVPLTPFSTHMTYSPLHGVAACNFGYSWAFQTQLRLLPALVSNYNNEEWKIYSNAYNVPESAKTDPNTAALYEKYKNNAFPCSDPIGLSTDTSFPDYVWLGSRQSGLVAIDLADPSADPLHLGASDDYIAGYPGFKEVFPTCTGFRGMTPVYSPDFDNEGRMWAAYACFDEAVKGGNGIQIYWWTKEDRRKMMEEKNVESLPVHNTINIKIPYEHPFFHKLIALRHPSNKNLLAVYIPLSNNRQVQLVDHKGTPDDTSDDVQRKVRHIVDQYGAVYTVDEVCDLKEDPLTGEIWVIQTNMTFAFDPKSDIENETIMGHTLDVSDGESKGNPLNYLKSHCVEFDEYGRMWVGTQSDGLWCFSADRKKVEGHYTMDNSSIPGNTVYGMVWNPSAKSMMISTDNGYAEFFPDVPSDITVRDENSLNVFPRKVMPDFTGTISINGAIPSERVNVRDRNGEIIVSLNADETGAVDWNLLDRNDRRVATGVYTVEANGGAVEIAVIKR